MFGHGGCGFPGKLIGRFMGGAPWANRGEHCGPGGPGALLRGLDLSDEQVQKVGELIGPAFIAFGHAKLDLMQAHRQLFGELSKPEIDRARVDALADEIKRQKSALTDRMVDGLVSLAGILTPDQRRKIRLDRIRGLLGLGEIEGPEA